MGIGPRSNSFREGLSRHKLQQQEVNAIRFLEVEEGSDVGMIQGCKQPGFPLEPGETFLVIRESFGEDFDGDFSFELFILGNIDLTHAASAYLLADLVMGKGTAYHGQWIRSFRRTLEKAFRFIPIVDERLDFFPKLRIGTAGLIQENGSFARRTF